MRGCGAFAVVALLCALTAPAAAQSVPTHGVRVPRVVPVGPGRLGLYVSVSNDKHKPVPGLTTEDFSFLLEGQPTVVGSVSTLQSKGEGIAISLLVDSSDSLPISEIELRDVAAAFASRRQAGDVLSIGTLDDEARGPARVWTSDADQLQRWVQGINQTNQTLLYEAMGKGLTRLTKAKGLPPMRAVLVLTDGVDYGSKDPWTYDGSRAMAQSAGIPVFSVWYPSTAAKSRTQGLEVMQTLADTTAAQVHMATAESGTSASKAQIDKAFDDFHATAHGIYRVEVETGAMALGGYTGQLHVAGAAPRRFAFELAAPVPPPPEPDAATSPPEPAEDEDGISVWVWVGAAAALLVIAVLVMLSLARDNAPEPEPSEKPRRRAKKPKAAGGERSPTMNLGDSVDTSQPLAGSDFGGDDWGLRTLQMADPFSADASVPAMQLPPVPAQRAKKTMVMMGDAVWWVTIHTGPQAGRRAAIGSDGALTLGAAGDADIQLAAGTVSGLHAQLRPVPGGIEVTDMGSTNGTFLQGVRQSGPFIVTHGQVFACGDCELSVSQE